MSSNERKFLYKNFYTRMKKAIETVCNLRQVANHGSGSKIGRREDRKAVGTIFIACDDWDAGGTLYNLIDRIFIGHSAVEK